MRIICAATLVFISLITNAQHYLLKNESVIFSFDTQSGKHVLLAKDKDNAYIVYRYGNTDSIEFEYPEKNRDSWKKFEYSYYVRGGGVQNDGMELNYLYFTNNGYKYSIYDTHYAAHDKSAIGINVMNLKTNKTVDIKGAEKSRKGTIADFRNNNLVEIVDYEQ